MFGSNCGTLGRGRLQRFASELSRNFFQDSFLPHDNVYDKLFIILLIQFNIKIVVIFSGVYVWNIVQKIFNNESISNSSYIVESIRK